ncbi:MAG: gliding motility-associated C-terminal domain-containing protein, partial [Bacteroidota bacterium]
IRAQDDEFTIDLNTTLEQANIIENDFMDDDSAVKIELMGQPENGLVTLEDNQLKFQPNTNFFGTEIINYQICPINCPDNCDEAQVLVKVVDNAKGADCFAPNVITPNNDGMNDCLKIPCVANHPNSQLKVFNRWGDMVHESDRYENDWAGTYNGNPLPNGTYFYLLQMSADDEPMQGYFTIVR